ncbi:MAG: diaminopimelate epimerase [Elusimicrobiota bacterium]
MKLEFTKIEATGNDFILVDGLDPSWELPEGWEDIVEKICTRNRGVGADGVLLLEKDSSADFKMRIFNSDGGEVEMCGNGARCVAYYYSRKTGRENIKFTTLAGLMRAQKGKDNMVKLSLPDPRDIQLDMLLNIEGRELSGSYINTGVPHVIVETKKLDSLDVEKLGRGIRYNKKFAPEGTNADFVSKEDENTVKIRTYERGVEEETLACGTGVIAGAVVENLKGRVEPPVEVITRGGDIMKVYFKKNKDKDLISRVYNVKLEGPVNIVYTGTVRL